MADNLPLENEYVSGVQNDPNLPLDNDLSSGLGAGINANFSSDQNLVSGLPPNTNGGDIGNNIDNATIGQFSPSGSNVPSSDVAYIQNQLNPLGNQQLALMGATNELFQQGMNLPLQVGGTSGQLTGSRGIYAAQNQAVPFALLEQRRALQQQAALKRAKDLEKFKLKKPELSKDPRFNRNLVSTANEYTDIFVKRAEQEYGSHEAAMAALTSDSTKIGREFAQQMDNLDILAKEVDQVVDLNAEVEKAIESGDQYVSDETVKLHNDFKNLQEKFANGNAFGAASFRNQLQKLQTSQSVDQYFKENDVLKNISGEILQKAGIDDSRSDQFRTTTRYTQDFEKGAREQAKQMKQNVAFRNRQDLSEDDIFNRIMALKGKVDKRTASVKAKPQSSGAVNPNEIAVSDQKQVINVGGKNFNVNKSIDFSNDVKTKPIKFNGLTEVNPDGTLKTIEGVQNVVPGALKTIVDANGVERKVMTGQILKTSKNKITGKEENIYQDVILDYDNIKSGLSNSSKNAKTFVDVFDNSTTNIQQRTKDFADLAKDFEGNFSPEVEDVAKRFVNSGYNYDEFDKFVSSESRAGRDVVLSEDAKKQFNEDLKEETFNKLKAKVGKKTTEKSFKIKGESFTEKELRDGGWTDADIKTLK